MKTIWAVHHKYTEFICFDFNDRDDIVAYFECEDDAKAYVARHDNPRLSTDGERNIGKLTIEPINIIGVGEYNDRNNYGFINGSTEGGSVHTCPICGHATIVDYDTKTAHTKTVMENGNIVAVINTIEFHCECCDRDVVEHENRLNINSKSMREREWLAEHGYNLENYIYDESPFVRQVCARKGYGHDVFVNNPNEHPVVLLEIANQGKYLDVLRHHKNKSVRRLAKKKLRQMAKKKLRQMAKNK